LSWLLLLLVLWSFGKTAKKKCNLRTAQCIDTKTVCNAVKGEWYLLQYFSTSRPTSTLHKSLKKPNNSKSYWRLKTYKIRTQLKIITYMTVKIAIGLKYYYTCDKSKGEKCERTPAVVVYSEFFHRCKMLHGRSTIWPVLQVFKYWKYLNSI